MLNRPATSTQITHLSRIWLYVICGLVLLFLVAPTLLVIPMSFSGTSYLSFPPESWSLRWYESYFGSSEWMAATSVSLRVAVFASAISTVVGSLAAYGIHTTDFPIAKKLRSIFVVPMIIPVVLLGVGDFVLFSYLGLNNSILGLVLANTVMATPLVFITVGAGLADFDLNQEAVARSLGASRPKAFLTVTLPQIRSSVLSGAVLAFVVTLDEVVVALLIAGGQNATLTVRMFQALRDEIDPTIAAISSLLIALSLGLLFLSQFFDGHRKRQS